MTPLRWFPVIAAFVAVASSHGHADSRLAQPANSPTIIHDGAWLAAASCTG